jgi:hypothetical protein
MNSRLKTTLHLCVTLSVTFVCTACFAQTQTYDLNSSSSSQNWANSPQNWQNNPDNWQNSSQNWANSPQNWKNSPQNWQNNANNYNNNNGIYDRNGNRIGYSVPGVNGGINYFNADGSRRGYQPGH